MPRNKKKKEKKIKVVRSNSLEDRIAVFLQNLNHKGLKRECVLRGMPFDAVIGRSHFELVSWMYKNYENGQDPQKLVEYDAHLEVLLQQQGYKKGDAVLSPSLRLGFTKDMDRMEKIKDPGKIANVPKPEKKPKTEVDEKTGVRKGTKKAMTYELTNAGKDIDTIIKEVKKAFPDAEEKSVKIWHKRCLKTIKK